MKKILFLLFALSACAFPSTPGDVNLVGATKQYRAKLFESGARGQVVVQLADNVSTGGFFGKKYRNVMAFKNVQSGEVLFLQSRQDKQEEFDTAMLPIGKYEITNLYLEYVTVRTYQQGNMRVTETNVEKHEHFQRPYTITFDVKPGEVSYIGRIELVKGDNVVDPEGAKMTNTFKIIDKSAEIPDELRQKWETEFGRPLTVNLAVAKK